MYWVELRDDSADPGDKDGNQQRLRTRHCWRLAVICKPLQTRPVSVRPANCRCPWIPAVPRQRRATCRLARPTPASTLAYMLCCAGCQGCHEALQIAYRSDDGNARALIPYWQAACIGNRPSESGWKTICGIRFSDIMCVDMIEFVAKAGGPLLAWVIVGTICKEN
jgi:hypothetical protein